MAILYLATAQLGGKACPRSKLIGEADIPNAVGKLVEQGFLIQEIVCFKLASRTDMDSVFNCPFGFGSLDVNTKQPEIWIRNGRNRCEVEEAIRVFVGDHFTSKIIIVGTFSDIEASVHFEWTPNYKT